MSSAPSTLSPHPTPTGFPQVRRPYIAGRYVGDVVDVVRAVLCAPSWVAAPHRCAGRRCGRSVRRSTVVFPGKSIYAGCWPVCFMRYRTGFGSARLRLVSTGSCTLKGNWRCHQETVLHDSSAALGSDTSRVFGGSFLSKTTIRGAHPSNNSIGPGVQRVCGSGSVAGAAARSSPAAASSPEGSTGSGLVGLSDSGSPPSSSTFIWSPSMVSYSSRNWDSLSSWSTWSLRILLASSRPSSSSLVTSLSIRFSVRRL